RAPRDLNPPGRNQRGLAESYLILKSEVAERFLHSGTAKTAVPPVEMTSFRWWRTWKKPNFAEVSLFARRKDGPGGGSRTHTGSDPRQILSLLRLPVPPLRENYTENSMSGVWGKGARWARRRCARASGAAIPPLRGPTRQKAARKKQSGRSGRDDNSGLGRKSGGEPPQSKRRDPRPRHTFRAWGTRSG